MPGISRANPIPPSGVVSLVTLINMTHLHILKHTGSPVLRTNPTPPQIAPNAACESSPALLHRRAVSYALQQTSQAFPLPWPRGVQPWSLAAAHLCWPRAITPAATLPPLTCFPRGLVGAFGHTVLPSNGIAEEGLLPL